MKNRLRLLILFILLIIPTSVFALSSDYKDVTSSIVNEEIVEDKLTIYIFEGKSCPHCKEELEWLNELKESNNNILVKEYEVWYNKKNAELLKKVGSFFNTEIKGVPFTIIGDSYYVGYSSLIKDDMNSKIEHYLSNESSIEDNFKKLPLLGKVNVKNVSLPLVSVILGFIDGFNPCAMWILIFLISMLINLEDKKKKWLIGFIFLFTSGMVYFLSMLGINVVLSMVQVSIIRMLIGIFIFIMGVLSLRKYIKNRKSDIGCTIVNAEKRKTMSKRIKRIISSKSFILSILGIIILAISVNLVELACSLGFPVVFSEILAMNNIHGFLRIIYLLIYVLFYMLDDIVVFIISMVTLETTGITNKYNKICTLISTIIMLIMGLLLVLKPEWVMLNF